ncbi:MAG: 1-acyl-sn-glycerol-3-phosphate acyltransferase [Alphaproteobacteria bacterium]|nr:1-acyl-sn-glycerol-3-phosphate acyltransferase [Alphaproteobacteria bacterium]
MTVTPLSDGAAAPSLADRLRSILFALLFYPVTVAIVILYLPLLLLPTRWSQPLCYSWIRLFLGMSRAVLGVRYRVSVDPEAAAAIAEGPVIYASKHQSMWETLAFNELLGRPAFVLKRELERIPLFGLYLKTFGMVAVDRAAGASALKGMVRQAAEQTALGRSIVIYPQGTRVAPGDHKPYLPGVAALYQKLDAPVVPVTLDSGRYWPRRTLVKRAGVIEVRLLAPIPPGLDRKTFLRTLEERIESACG